MAWDDVIKIVLTTIVGLGGSAAIIGMVVAFSANRIADRLSAKYELKLNKELEQFKNGLEKKNYVSKVRFDAEFAIYRELTVACHNMINDTYFLYPLLGSHPKDKDARTKYEQEIFEKASKSLAEFKIVVNGNAPFIPQKIYENFSKISDLCNHNIILYALSGDMVYDFGWKGSQGQRESEVEAYARTEDIRNKFNTLVDDIRNYLTLLDVNEMV